MTKRIVGGFLTVCVLYCGYYFIPKESSKDSREAYEDFLNHHPFQSFLKSSGEQHESTGETDRPDLAMKQNYLQTMDPILKRPTPESLTPYNKPTANARDKKSGSANARSLSTSIGSGTMWVERGPKSVGGRTRTLMFDPNDAQNKKIWAGGVSGGLWSNNDITDANSGWNKVNDFWDNLAITCMAADPIDPKIFYVGTGEGWFNLDQVMGAGIWKSIDKGVSWTQLASTTNFYFINDVVVRKEGSVSVIYAAVKGTSHKGFNASANNGLFRSDNGGSAWTQVLPSSAVDVTYPTDIEIGKDNKIYVGSDGKFSGNKSALYTSTTGLAGSWTTRDFTISGNDLDGRIEIACAPSNENIVYILIAHENKIGAIGKSVDKGVTFSTVSLPVDKDMGIPADDFSRDQAWYDLTMAVDPNDANKVFVGAIDLFQSVDGGTNWSQISKWSNNSNLNTLSCSFVHADQHMIVFRPGNVNKMAVSNDGGVYYSDDITNASTAQVFQERNLNYNVTQFYSAAIHPDKITGTNYMLAGAQDNGTQQFTASGFGSTIEANGGDGSFCFIDQKDPSFQILSYVYNTYKLSSNGGISFDVQLLDDENHGNFINQGDYDSNLKILFSANSTTAIYRVKNVTTNHGEDSIKINNMGSVATAFRVSPYTTSSTTLYVGTQAGKLFRINNANLATPVITQITTPFPNGTISSIAVGASENQLAVTFSNYGVASIWETRNAGTSWFNREGNLPNMPVRWVEYHPQNFDQLYIATELGVWSTDNINVTAPTWNSTNGGLANVRTDMLRIRKSDNTIMAATHGRGVFTARIPSDLDQTISFKTFTSKTFGDPPFKIWAQSTSGLPITFTSTNSSVATVVDSTVTIVGGGAATLVASQPGNISYNAATSVIQVLLVNKASQTVTFSALAEKDVNDPAFTITATSTSALPVSFTSSATTVATVAGNTVTIKGPGTTMIKATQAGNGNFLAATDVPQNLKVVTRIIQLTGVLDFGDIFLGEDDQKTFTVSSIGTGPIEISNIIYPTGYTGSATPSGNSISVTVTFTPVNVIDYNGNITVESNKTSGTNTITVNGKGVKITTLRDQEEADGYEVYPNPTKDFIYIKSIVPVTKIELIDSQGRTSKEIVTMVDDLTGQIDLSKYASGHYFLVIPTKAGQVVKKILKD
ncbi:MAG: T9SS type A sorting domain-containing protein [Bacteroidia bacterium]|nr:T9SS type A sorting domain-containing protein [Bacteroidia bacterium]